MKILILGAGKMGTFFTDVLCTQHEVALFDVNPHNLRFVFNTYRLTKYEEIQAFKPELVINAVTLKYTIEAFKAVIPYLPKECILSDIASVKTGLQEFYESTNMRYVSSHPNVWTYFCQFGRFKFTKCYYHFGIRPYGKSIFQRSLS